MIYRRDGGDVRDGRVRDSRDSSDVRLGNSMVLDGTLINGRVRAGRLG